LIALRSRSRGGTFAGDPRSIELSLVDAAFVARGLTIRPRFLDILSSISDERLAISSFVQKAYGGVDELGT
jgi:hypothetical protein